MVKIQDWNYEIDDILIHNSLKIENEIKEMREDYAQKKEDMLEKTRLVCFTLVCSD